MRQYLAEDLIEVVRDKAALGSSVTEGTTDEDILRHLNDEALTRIYNAVMHVREEYYVRTESVPVVSGAVRYRIPHRAMQSKLREVFWVESDGSRWEIFPKPRSDRAFFSGYPSSLNRPVGFYFEGNHIVLMPDTATSMAGSLLVAYYQRPGELVLSTSARQVVSVASGVVTVDSEVPADWTTGVTLDFHSNFSGAETKAWDITPSLISGSSLTCTVANVDGSIQGRYAVEPGDWVSMSETAALPAIPREWHPVLAQAAVVSIMETIDPERYPQSAAALDKSIERMYIAATSRDDGYAPAIPLSGSVFFSGGA